MLVPGPHGPWACAKRLPCEGYPAEPKQCQEKTQQAPKIQPVAQALYQACAKGGPEEAIQCQRPQHDSKISIISIIVHVVVIMIMNKVVVKAPRALVMMRNARFFLVQRMNITAWA